MAAVCLTTASLAAKPNGVEARLGVTGGPFPGEQSCGRAQCHNVEPNSGPGGVFMSVNGAPMDDYKYIPNETIEVLVRVADPSQGRWGYQITARPESDGCVNAGKFQQVPGSIVRASDEAIGSCGAGLEFGIHAFAAAGPNEATFTINWTAPSEDIGPIIFAAAGNAANGNGEKTGDNVYTTTARVEAPAPEPLPMPAISQDAIVVANLNPSINNVSANTLMTAFGQNFAAPGTLVVQPEVDGSGKVADNLSQTCVEVNGALSAMFAVVDTQVNFQAPSNLVGVEGPVEVVVIQRCGTSAEQRSAPMTVNAGRVSPGFFVFPQFGGENGANPIATLLGGGPSIVAPDGLFAGAAPIPAGEFGSFFATGFGVTDPFVQAGEIPQTVLPAGVLASVTGSFSLTIGGMAVPPEDIFFVGAAPCCAGLYQVTARIPAALPAGNHEVIATVDGVSTPEGPFVPVAEPAVAP